MPAVLPTNTEEVLAGLTVLERVLVDQTFLLGSKFSVTDIVVGFAINWSKSAGHLGAFPALSAYLDRLYSRELCAFKQHE